MKLAVLILFVLSVVALMSPAAARPAKIPIKAIKKGAEAVGKGLRAVNIAGAVHDVVGFFQHRKKKKH